MYYQVGAATIRQIPYPGSGTNFPYTEKPRNSDHVGSEFRGKDTAKTDTYQTNSPAVISRVIKLFRGLFLGLISACFSHFSTVL